MRGLLNNPEGSLILVLDLILGVIILLSALVMTIFLLRRAPSEELYLMREELDLKAMKLIRDMVKDRDFIRFVKEGDYERLYRLVGSRMPQGFNYRVEILAEEAYRLGPEPDTPYGEGVFIICNMRRGKNVIILLKIWREKE